MPRYQCEECDGKVFVDSEAYRRHMRGTTHKPHQCPRCFKSYLNERALQKHFRRELRKNNVHNIYECHGCAETFSLERSFIAHVCASHPEEHCHICGYMVAMDEWNTHVQESSAHKLCKDCDLYFDTQEQYGRHLILPHHELFCDRCNRYFHTQSSLKEHEGAENHYRCYICDAWHNTTRSLRAHLSERHSTARNVPPGQQEGRMIVSQLESPDAENVSQEQSQPDILTTSRPHCPDCTQRYLRFEDLVQHVVVSHPDVYGIKRNPRAVQCRNCNLEFVDEIAMYLHMFNEHLSPAEAIRFLDQLRLTMQGLSVAQEGPLYPLDSSADSSTDSSTDSDTDSLESASTSSSGLHAPVDARFDVGGNSESPSTQIDAGSSIPISNSEMLAEDESRPSSRSLSFSSSMSEPVLVPDPEEHVPVLSEDDHQGSIADEHESISDFLGSSEESQESTPAAPDYARSGLPFSSVSEQSATSTQEPPQSPDPPRVDVPDTSHHETDSRGTAPPILVLRCGVCSNSPTNPLATLCGHVFCYGCVMTEVLRAPQCPTCRAPVFVRLNVAP